MTSENLSLRASDFMSPARAAERMTAALRQLREQLTVRRQLVDVLATTDAAGAVAPIVLKPPSWPVKGLRKVYAWDTTANAPAYVREAWRYENGSISVTLSAADVAASKTYALRLELTGE